MNMKATKVFDPPFSNEAEVRKGIVQRIRFKASKDFEVVALHEDEVEIRFEVEKLDIDLQDLPHQLTISGYEPIEVDEIIGSIFVTAIKIQAMKILKSKMTIPRS